MKLFIIVIIALVVLLVGGGTQKVEDNGRLVVFSFGEFKHLAGPGWTGTWPVLEYGTVIQVGQTGELKQAGWVDFDGYLVPVEGSRGGAGEQVIIEAFREGKVWVRPPLGQ